MARKNKNARRRVYGRITFKQICQKLNISTRERIILLRNMKYREKINKGGEI